MSYILPDEFQEGLIDNFKLVMNDKEIKNARFSYAKNQTKKYKEICKRACLTPNHNDVIIAWFHLGNRYLRGLI
jgi:hypothetical protein